ncbi:glycoside hydrolase family 32 protein [Sphingomonas aliaeris]|uniref:Glycoside hydrolase family 32 protein n=2 Tax=Sphingomonas aliaeris TaxID=2759526 RepID=A0A974S4N5_9SPHN|nr:glycoside hydrolase family 32 protein [Sphingomonas aliaeris]
MNDPNGLVYFDGEYHLFYQYNPHGIGWGHMSWGHAVSTDLLVWDELPVAIPETDQMIFSGCCVIDWNDTSGLGDGTVPPMLAYFTAHDDATKRQTQHIAYSLDRGRTFKHYAGNPIIDLGLEHFRDPKVFFHADTAAWIMAVALPREHKVQFYRSTDLLAWTLASEFGPAGATSGQWECPDIFLVPIDGRPDESHWVLKVDVDNDFVDGGSGAQYFVGDFDGTQFVVDPERGAPDGDLVDFGPDFYAAVSWSDLPPDRPGPLWIGWMSNHQTGKDYPTDPWRGAQSLPRTLFLFEEKGRLRLGQRPAQQITPPAALAETQAIPGATIPIFTLDTPAAKRVLLTSDTDARFRLDLSDDTQVLLSIEVDRPTGSIWARRASTTGLPPAFARSTACTLPMTQTIAFDIHFDGYLVEIFIDGGRRVYSACLFPKTSPALGMTALSGNVSIRL